VYEGLYSLIEIICGRYQREIMEEQDLIKEVEQHLKMHEDYLRSLRLKAKDEKIENPKN